MFQKSYSDIFVLFQNLRFFCYVSKILQLSLCYVSLRAILLCLKILAPIFCCFINLTATFLLCFKNLTARFLLSFTYSYLFLMFQKFYSYLFSRFKILQLYFCYVSKILQLSFFMFKKSYSYLLLCFTYSYPFMFQDSYLYFRCFKNPTAIFCYVSAIVTLMPRQTRSISAHSSQARAIPDLLSLPSLQHATNARLEVVSTSANEANCADSTEVSSPVHAIDLTKQALRQSLPPSPELVPLDMSIGDRLKSAAQSTEDFEAFQAANALASLHRSGQPLEASASVQNGGRAARIQRAEGLSGKETSEKDVINASIVDAVSSGEVGSSSKNNLPYKLRFKYSKADTVNGESVSS